MSVGHVPIHVVKNARQQVAPAPKLDVTSLFMQTASLTSAPLGDFQANRLFSLPLLVDTKSMDFLMTTLMHGGSGTRDETPLLRLILLSECLVMEEKAPLLTQVPTRVGGDLVHTSVTRTNYSEGQPEGMIMVVDLVQFLRMMFERMKGLGGEAFLNETWGTTTAIAPIRSEMRSTGPYIWSFVTTAYWNSRIKYTFRCQSVADVTKKVDITTFPNASLGAVDGEVNVLLVLTDQELKTNGHMGINIANNDVKILGTSA